MKFWYSLTTRLWRTGRLWMSHQSTIWTIWLDSTSLCITSQARRTVTHNTQLTTSEPYVIQALHPVNSKLHRITQRGVSWWSTPVCASDEEANAILSWPQTFSSASRAGIRPAWPILQEAWQVVRYIMEITLSSLWHTVTCSYRACTWRWCTWMQPRPCLPIWPEFSAITLQCSQLFILRHFDR